MTPTPPSASHPALTSGRIPFHIREALEGGDPPDSSRWRRRATTATLAVAAAAVVAWRAGVLVS